jgi:glycosyltransferase involved in cell wall biosynthesis
MDKPKLSIIIPVLNEEGNIEQQNSKIKKALGGKVSYEVIWVDDGSTDKTPEILSRLAKQDPNVHGVTLMRQVGQSGALMAGVDMAQGEYIGTMDGDNQNDPDEFLTMLEKLENEELDAVVGWRKERWQGNVLRRLPSLIANALIKSSLKGGDIHDAGCPVKLMRASLLKEIRLYGELHRFLSYIIYMNGARIGEIPVKHRERTSGQSKYGIGRTFTVIFDILNVRFITTRKKTPIQLFGPMGMLLYVIGLILAGYLGYMQIFSDIDVSRSPYFILSIMSFILGTQFITFGLLGELVIRSYYENNLEKKTYSIRKKY